MKKLIFVLTLLIPVILTSQPCLPEGITFTTQEQIDNFQTDNPGCTEIEGDVTIGNWNGTNITNLSGLNALTSIGGHLEIWGNHSLTSLSGLDNLISIGGYLAIHRHSVLTSLSGLDNLISIGGYLYIGLNPISSLLGIDNIDAASIDSLYIISNYALSTCEVQSICDYLLSPNGYVEIYDNASGCNSQEEVEEACEIVSVNEVTFYEDILAHPNPFATSTTLSYELKQPEKVTLSIYNHLGQVVYQTQKNQPQGSQQLIWNAERFADGIYYYRILVGDAVANGKMVKVR